MATVTITLTDLDPPEDGKTIVVRLTVSPLADGEPVTPARDLGVKLVAAVLEFGRPAGFADPVQAVLDGLIGGYEELDDAGRAELLDLAEAWAAGERRAEVTE